MKNGTITGPQIPDIQQVVQNQWLILVQWWAEMLWFWTPTGSSLENQRTDAQWGTRLDLKLVPAPCTHTNSQTFLLHCCQSFKSVPTLNTPAQILHQLLPLWCHQKQRDSTIWSLMNCVEGQQQVKGCTHREDDVVRALLWMTQTGAGDRKSCHYPKASRRKGWTLSTPTFQSTCSSSFQSLTLDVYPSEKYGWWEDLIKERLLSPSRSTN